MRMTQVMGLTEKAKKFIEKNVGKVPLIVCPKCQHVVSEKLDGSVWKDEKSLGMFDDGPKLYSYYLKNGLTIKEVVQATTYSSGPVIFLCLEDSFGKQLFKWSKKEIENA